MRNPVIQHHAGRIGALSRSRPKDDPELESARRDLAVATISETIKKVVAQAPPFTPEQVAQLHVLLEPARAELSELDGGVA